MKMKSMAFSRKLWSLWTRDASCPNPNNKDMQNLSPEA